MLIDGRDAPAQVAEPGLRWWEGERFRIGWKGHVYLPGKAAGTPSVAELAARLEDRTLAALAKEDVPDSVIKAIGDIDGVLMVRYLPHSN